MKIFSFFILFIFISNNSLGFDLKKLGDSLQKDLGGALKELENQNNNSLKQNNSNKGTNQTESYEKTENGVSAKLIKGKCYLSYIDSEGKKHGYPLPSGTPSKCEKARKNFETAVVPDIENRIKQKKQEQVKFANRDKEALKIEKESFKKRKVIYDNANGEIKNVFKKLEDHNMKFMENNLKQIKKIGGTLNDFQDDKKHLYIKKSRKLYYKNLAEKSKKIESENDNLRLALDVLNYLYTGSKKDRKIGVLSSKGCIFYLPSPFRIYDFDKIIPETVKLGYEGKLFFQGDENVGYRYKLVYYQYYQDVSDPTIFNKKIEITAVKSDSIFLKKDIDFDRARKAVRLLFSKSCKGAKESEF